MDKPVQLKISLPKVPNIELVAVAGLEQLAEHMAIPEEKTGEAKILVTEAIINALEHAGDINPTVDVEFTISREKMVIFVRDYGTGFNPDEVENPDIAIKIKAERKRGWGLKLMKSMSDDFIIESGSDGTKITMIKKLT